MEGLFGLLRAAWPRVRWFWRRVHWFWRLVSGLAVVLLVAGLVAQLLGDVWLSNVFTAVFFGVLVVSGGGWLFFVVLVPARGLAARLVVGIAGLAYVAGFQVLTVVLATAGAPGGPVYDNQRGDGGATVGVLVAIISLGLVLAVVVIVPQALRLAGRSMDDTREPARSLLPSWVAGVLTWVYVFLLRFGDGALSGRGFSTVAVAAWATGVAVLLLPAYRFFARACGGYGLENVLDPARWVASARAVLAELGDSAPVAAVPQGAPEEPYPA